MKTTTNARTGSPLVLAGVLTATLLGCATPSVDLNTLYNVIGSEMSAQQQAILVYKNAKLVSGLSVKVNDQPIAESSSGYVGLLAAPVAVGGKIRLEITTPQGAITASDVVPAAPIITAPIAQSSVSVSQPLEVNWDSSSNPDRFTVSAATVDPKGLTQGISLSSNTGFLPGSARSVTIPANALPSGASVAKIRLFVSAYNDGTETFQGVTLNAAGSRLAIGSEQAKVEFVPTL